MRRCAARYCPDDVTEESAEQGAVLCSQHYDSLAWELKTWLASAYGTETWQSVLREVVRHIFRVESEQRAQPW
jgi:hypothetical protein